MLNLCKKIISRSNLTRRNYSNKVVVLKSTSNDAIFNLATEEWIFRELNPEKQTLFLWRNGPTVVIGKHQNPWKECHISNMEQAGVTLARRQSGGGAVYQDLGNTCFTFLSSKNDYSIERNMSIICNALKEDFNINVQVTGRNDITLVGDGRKISGSAFKQTNKSCFHHGTIMINVDVDALTNYLNPNILKLQSKGVSSVRGRVANLSQISSSPIDHDLLSQSIINQFFKTYNDTCDVSII
eukprot:TRINITY_DN7166_c0_g2_i1.p1 TRINITY_DN7166_c0_g2~~TRINITY_DN7166_c0_g2_i1.p1  ORF type:complete len:241 (+),score=17.29 TRINITY_DN7166_c0_g2_i1:33-755(+)